MNKHLAVICTLLIALSATGKQASGQDGGNVSNIVTDAFYNSIINQTQITCPGRRFYSRANFLQATGSYPAVGTTGSPDDWRREIAAFFAHVAHATSSLCDIEEFNGRSKIYCDNSKQYPCVPNQKYFGRGPFQVMWNYNYGPIGQSIGFNGLQDPGIVARDPVLSWKTALLMWMNNGHTQITSGQGFGATIKAISGAECNGANPSAVASRVRFYTTHCSRLGVSPGNNLSC